MARPCCPRRVNCVPDVTFFKPAGVPLSKLEISVLGLDEYEAIRLADKDGLEHAAAAKKMGVSRQTFTRIVSAARKKIAHFLAEGNALKIEGGVVNAVPQGARCCKKKSTDCA